MSLELAVLFPVLALLVFGIVQTGLYLFARQLALSAARSGLDAARDYGGSPGAGTARARGYLDGQNHGLLHDVDVTFAASATSVTVSVHARVVSLIPGFPIDVDQHATGPIERVTTP